MSNDGPDMLAARAGTLRLLALRLRFERAAWLCSQAGPSTWVGPTPSWCLAQMNEVRTKLHRAADDLDAAARRLEQQAQLQSAATGAGRVLVR